MKFKKSVSSINQAVESGEIREMTMEEIDNVVATGTYTSKEMCLSESYTRILETKSILKKLHLT